MSRFAWAAMALVLVLLLAGSVWFLRSVREAPLALARSLSQAVGEKLHAHPRVVIHRNVVVEEKQPIAELAVVSRATDVEQRLTSERFLSEAKLSLRATYAVKAGFDLRSPDFLLELDPEGGRANLLLPAPRVLSVEMTRYQVLEDRSGYWHKFTETQRELALHQLQAEARLEAIRAGILDDCKREIERWLAAVSARHQIAFEFAYKRQGDSLAVPWRPGETVPDQGFKAKQ